MRIAVFSDIHGNLSAFTACLAYAKHLGAEGFAFLGDLISDGPDPHALMEQIRKLADQKPCWFVRGNREDYQLRHHKDPDDGWKPGSQFGSLLYTYEHLTPEDIAFLASMPKSERLEVPACPPVRMCHGTPTNLKEMIYPGAEQADNLLKSVEETTVLCGHCHLQYRYEAAGKQLINPGALGIHANGQTKAQFALIRCEDGRWIARLLNVDYDRVAELKRYEDSGLVEMGGIYTKLRQISIRTGQDRLCECLTLARQLAQADKGQPVEDMYWEAAAKQLGII